MSARSRDARPMRPNEYASPEAAPAHVRERLQYDDEAGCYYDPLNESGYVLEAGNALKQWLDAMWHVLPEKERERLRANERRLRELGATGQGDAATVAKVRAYLTLTFTGVRNPLSARP